MPGFKLNHVSKWGPGSPSNSNAHQDDMPYLLLYMHVDGEDDLKTHSRPRTWLWRGSPNRRSRWKLAFPLLNMFNLRLCNAATIRYFLLKFGHMHLCGKDYKYVSPNGFRCNSFGCIAAISCGNACHGPQSDSVYSGSEHRQFNSPRLVKREAGFPNPRRALIGSIQLWRVNDSPYYREYAIYHTNFAHSSRFVKFGCGFIHVLITSRVLSLWLWQAYVIIAPVTVEQPGKGYPSTSRGFAKSR